MVFIMLDSLPSAPFACFLSVLKRALRNLFPAVEHAPLPLV